MPHVTVIRRLARKAVTRGIREATTFDPDRKKELRAEFGGFGVGVDVPDTVDSFGDLPL